MSRRCRQDPVGGGSCWGPNFVKQVEKVAPKKKKRRMWFALENHHQHYCRGCQQDLGLGGQPD